MRLTIGLFGKLPDLEDNMNAERIRYYYCRDKKNRPVVTVCLLQANGNISRGVAVCSILDNPCKKTGRKISRDRAVYAMKTKANNCNMDTARAHLVMRSVYEGGGGIFNWFKSAFNPPLTQLENKLVYGEGI